MFRSIALGGTKRLEFRVEGGNILNHPVFGNPEGNVTSATFMQISSIPGGDRRQRWPEQRGLHGTADPAGRAVPVLNANDTSAPLRIVRGGADAFCTVRRSPGESPRQAAFLHSSRHPRCCYGRPRVGPVAASGIASPRARHVSAHGAGWHLEGLQGCDRPAVGLRGKPRARRDVARLGTVGGRPPGLRPLPGALAASLGVSLSRRASSCSVSRDSTTRPGSFKQAVSLASPDICRRRVGLAETTFEAGRLEKSRRLFEALVATSHRPHRRLSWASAGSTPRRASRPAR